MDWSEKLSWICNLGQWSGLTAEQLLYFAQEQEKYKDMNEMGVINSWVGRILKEEMAQACAILKTEFLVLVMWWSGAWISCITGLWIYML